MGYAQEKVMPYGEHTPKTGQVRKMFDNIAPSYDALNHFLSLGIDRRWRRKAIDAVKGYKHDRVLDIATGTGDFAILLAQCLSPKEIVAADISEKMMEVGREKIEALNLSSIVKFQKEDCENLSFEAASFDLVAVAYGVRNFADLDRGLREILRVLREGGVALILELCSPRSFPIKQLFQLYSRFVIPTAGRFISHDKRAYTYLPATIETFPQGEAMHDILIHNGFSRVTFKRFTFGISTMYIAQK